MATVVTHTIRPPHPGSLIVPYSSPLPTHPPRLSFIPTSTYGCSGSTVVTDARAHGLVVVTLVCTVFDKGLGLNRTINGIGKKRKRAQFVSMSTRHARTAGDVSPDADNIDDIAGLFRVGRAMTTLMTTNFTRTTRGRVA